MNIHYPNSATLLPFIMTLSQMVFEGLRAWMVSYIEYKMCPSASFFVKTWVYLIYRVNAPLFARTVTPKSPFLTCC